MTQRTRIMLEVYVDLDDCPGPFHSKESARNHIASLLDNNIPHYKPMVSIGRSDSGAEVNPERAEEVYRRLAEDKEEEDAHDEMEALYTEFRNLVASVYAGYTGGPPGSKEDKQWGPNVRDDFDWFSDGREDWAISWEEGPFYWSYDLIDDETGRISEWLDKHDMRVEAINGWSCALYKN